VKAGKVRKAVRHRASWCRAVISMFTWGCD